MLIADTNEFHPLVDGRAYAAGRAPDGTPYAVVIVRATYSTYHVDLAYAASIAQARSGGLVVGHYGYMAKGDDPAAFGRFLAQTILAHGGLKPGDTIWVDDEETLGGNESPRIAAALEAAHAILNDNPVDEGEYSGDAFFRSHIAVRVQANGVTTHLWIASYNAPAPADGEELFQFTDSRTMPGVSGPCDCSIFNGTLADWMRIFAGQAAQGPGVPASTVAPAPPTPAPTKIGDNVQHLPIQATLNAAGWTAVGVTLPAGMTKDNVINVEMDGASPFDGNTADPWEEATAEVDFATGTSNNIRVVVKGTPGHFYTGRVYFA